MKLLMQDPSDIVTLRAFNESFTGKLDLTTDESAKSLFNCLSLNLLKNQREVRLQTLKALTKAFA